MFFFWGNARKDPNAADLVPGDMDFHLLHGRDLDRSVFHSGCGATPKMRKKGSVYWNILKQLVFFGSFAFICLISMCPTSLACYTWAKTWLSFKLFQAAKTVGYPSKMWSKPIQQCSTPQKTIHGTRRVVWLTVPSKLTLTKVTFYIFIYQKGIPIIKKVGQVQPFSSYGTWNSP